MDTLFSMDAEERRGTFAGLGAEPGLCADCRFAHLTSTRRGTSYLRCLRAAEDDRFPKYPPLPVRDCPGFVPVTDLTHRR